MKNLKLNNVTGRELLTGKYSKNLPNEVVSMGKDGIKIKDKVVMVRAQITGGQTISKLIDDQEDRKVGYTDFSKGELKDNTNLVVRAVQFAIGTHASIVDAAKIFYTRKLTASTDAVAASAVLRIKQGGAVLFEANVSDLMSEELERGSNGMIGFELEEEFFIKEGVVVEAELEYPKNLAVDATAKWFAQLKLIGQSTSNK